MKETQWWCEECAVGLHVPGYFELFLSHPIEFGEFKFEVVTTHGVYSQLLQITVLFMRCSKESMLLIDSILDSINI